jgi:hypothetical protein
MLRGLRRAGGLIEPFEVQDMNRYIHDFTLVKTSHNPLFIVL